MLSILVKSLRIIYEYDLIIRIYCAILAYIIDYFFEDRDHTFWISGDRQYPETRKPLVPDQIAFTFVKKSECIKVSEIPFQSFSIKVLRPEQRQQ
jgi:hypothetical protein